jgi:DNA-binding NarL/FixJ family response regulator
MSDLEARSESKTAAPQQKLIEPLSELELEILGVLATGASNREIANKLFITEGTVKNHITNILGKLGVRDRTQAALKAKDMGLI